LDSFLPKLVRAAFALASESSESSRRLTTTCTITICISHPHPHPHTHHHPPQKHGAVHTKIGFKSPHYVYVGIDLAFQICQ
jgi:hypothetical protein